MYEWMYKIHERINKQEKERVDGRIDVYVFALGRCVFLLA